MLATSDSIGFTGDVTAIGHNPGHLHADLELNIMVTGSCRYHAAGRFVTLPQGRLVALWGALPHGVVHPDPGTIMAWITVPIHVALRWPGIAAALPRLMRGGFIADAGDPAGDLGSMRRWIGELRGRDEDVQAIARLEIEARVRRLVRGSGQRDLAQPADSATAKSVERMTAWMQRRFRGDCPAAEVAAAAGMHPTAAMRAFRSRCGTTIHDYLITLRLAEAHRLLLTTDKAVLDIAMAAGFGSQARFYAAFAKAYGHPPSQVRR